MKSKVSPAMFAVICVITVLVLGIMGWKFLAPRTSGPSEDLKAPKLDISNVNSNDFDQVKKDIQSANTSRNAVK